MLLNAGSLVVVEAESVIVQTLLTMKLSFSPHGLSGAGMRALAGLFTGVDGEARYGGVGMGP